MRYSSRHSLDIARNSSLPYSLLSSLEDSLVPPYAMLQAGVFRGNSPIQLEKVKRTKEQELILHLVVGAVVMPSLIGKSRLMDYLAIANAGV